MTSVEVWSTKSETARISVIHASKLLCNLKIVAKVSPKIVSVGGRLRNRVIAHEMSGRHVILRLKEDFDSDSDHQPVSPTGYSMSVLRVMAPAKERRKKS